MIHNRVCIFGDLGETKRRGVRPSIPGTIETHYPNPSVVTIESPNAASKREDEAIGYPAHRGILTT